VTEAWGMHAIEFNEDAVIKRFRSRQRDEPQREWGALRLLHQYAPGLAPVPLREQLAGDPPLIVMSRIPGTPLRGQELTRQKLSALAESVETLHNAVPTDRIWELPPCTWYPPVVDGKARAWSAAASDLGTDPLVAQAFEVGQAWLARTSQAFSLPTGIRPVFGLSDGNLANYIWDGTRVRCVDFEISGRSDRAFELAEIVEHISMWAEAVADTSFFLAQFDLTAQEAGRLQNFRILFAYIWLLMLLPGQRGAHRNPPGTLNRQARHFLEFLG
jgi:hypothetical protein